MDIKAIVAAEKAALEAALEAAEIFCREEGLGTPEAEEFAQTIRTWFGSDLDTPLYQQGGPGSSGWWQVEERSLLSPYHLALAVELGRKAAASAEEAWRSVS